MSNFGFLKKKNENFYKIIAEAEKLFRDEYYEQVVVQTRRFAENICRDLLQDKIQPDETFDSMINKIKDNSSGNTRMKEFSEDLYFIKKYGNMSAHSSKSSITPEIALECIERAYELSIFYSHMKYGVDKNIEKILFSEEALMSGKKPLKKSLKERYANELTRHRENTKKTQTRKSNKSKPINTSKVSKKAKKKKTNKPSNFKLMILIITLLFLVFFFFEFFT